MSLGDIGEFLDENNYSGEPIEIGFEDSGMDIEETKFVRPKSKSKKWNWKRCFLRELMRGAPPSQILRKYGDLINKHNFLNTATKFINDNYGVIGFLVIDVSLFDDTFNYSDIPAKMRQFNAFAINSRKARKIVSTDYLNTNDGTMDGFIASDDKQLQTVTYADNDTGLNIISSMEEISDDDLVLDEVADAMLRKNIISLAERGKLKSASNKFAVLCRAMRRSLMPKVGKTGKIENVASDYHLANYNLSETPIKAVKNINVRADAVKLDKIDVGKNAKPMSIKGMVKKSEQLDDFTIARKQKKNVAVKLDGEAKLDEIEVAKRRKSQELTNLVFKSELSNDIEYDKKHGEQKFSNVLYKSDVKNDIDYDNEFSSLADVELDREMEIETLDGIDAAFFADVDDADFFGQDATDDEIEYDGVKQDDLKISNKYDFGW